MASQTIGSGERQSDYLRSPVRRGLSPLSALREVAGKPPGLLVGYGLVGVVERTLSTSTK